MHRGIVGVIVCPMLEDELIYNLVSDQEDSTVYLVMDEHAESMAKKLSDSGIPFTPIDDRQFDNSVDGIDRNNLNFVIKMNTLGLHEDPKKLKAKVEEQIIMAQGRFDVLMLFYGLCGNHGWDISEWAAEHGYCPVTVFRDEMGGVCDDCIGAAIGGTARYLALMKKYTGMLYLTPAMATNWGAFNSSMSLFKGIDSNDHNMMRWVLELCGYKNALRIDTGLGDTEYFHRCADKVCEEMNLELLVAEEGWATLEPAKRIYSETKAALDKLL